jgi:tetratricopeptide (TPR) repeat protein
MKADDLAGKGLFNESLEAYNRSIAYDPYTVRAWMGKGRVLLSLDRPSEASESFTRALRLDPGNTEALTLLGDSRNNTGNYDGAIESYAKALAMNPNLAGIKDRIAQAELAKTAMSTPPTPEITVAPIETAVMSNSTAKNDTMMTSSSETPAAPPTLSAPFPGICVILLACGAGLMLVSGKRR